MPYLWRNYLSCTEGMINPCQTAAHWVVPLQTVPLCPEHGSGEGGETPQIKGWGMVWHLLESVKTSNILADFSLTTDVFPSFYLSVFILFLSFSLFAFSLFVSFFLLPQHLALPSHLPNSNTPRLQSLCLWTTSTHAEIKSIPSFGICRSWAWSVKVQTLSDQPFPW